MPVAQVLHAHGTSGELMIYPYLNDLSYYQRLREVALRDRERHYTARHVSRVRQAGERFLFQLAGISSIEAVQPLVGCEICVPRQDLPPPNPGEFYWFDLEGLAVLTEAGECLGRVMDFFPTGSNEVLVIRDGEREVLLPFIKDVILSVDEAQGCIRVRMLPGLM